MVVIEKAILHILDVNESNEVFSDDLLEMNEATAEFLIKHVEKTISSQDAKKKPHWIHLHLKYEE